MTAKSRLNNLARRALRRRTTLRIQLGYDPRGLVMMMRLLRTRDLVRLSPSVRAQLADIKRSQTWHGGPVHVSGRLFGLFIGGALTGIVELHTPTQARKVARISYWLSAASACWIIASRVVMKFVDWVAKTHGLDVFEVKWLRDRQVTDSVVSCRPSPMPDLWRFDHIVRGNQLSSA